MAANEHIREIPFSSKGDGEIDMIGYDLSGDGEIEYVGVVNPKTGEVDELLSLEEYEQILQKTNGDILESVIRPFSPDAKASETHVRAHTRFATRESLGVPDMLRLSLLEGSPQHNNLSGKREKWYKSPADDRPSKNERDEPSTMPPGLGFGASSDNEDIHTVFLDSAGDQNIDLVGYDLTGNGKLDYIGIVNQSNEVDQLVPISKFERRFGTVSKEASEPPRLSIVNEDSSTHLLERPLFCGERVQVEDETVFRSSPEAASERRHVSVAALNSSLSFDNGIGDGNERAASVVMEKNSNAGTRFAKSSLPLAGSDLPLPAQMATISIGERLREETTVDSVPHDRPIASVAHSRVAMYARKETLRPCESRRVSFFVPASTVEISPSVPHDCPLASSARPRSVSHARNSPTTPCAKRHLSLAIPATTSVDEARSSLPHERPTAGHARPRTTSLERGMPTAPGARRHVSSFAMPPADGATTATTTATAADTLDEEATSSSPHPRPIAGHARPRTVSHARGAPLTPSARRRVSLKAFPMTTTTTTVDTAASSIPLARPIASLARPRVASENPEGPTAPCVPRRVSLGVGSYYSNRLANIGENDAAMWSSSHASFIIEKGSKAAPRLLRSSAVLGVEADDVACIHEESADAKLESAGSFVLQEGRNEAEAISANETTPNDWPQTRSDAHSRALRSRRSFPVRTPSQLRMSLTPPTTNPIAVSTPHYVSATTLASPGSKLMPSKRISTHEPSKRVACGASVSSLVADGPSKGGEGKGVAFVGEDRKRKPRESSQRSLSVADASIPVPLELRKSLCRSDAARRTSELTETERRQCERNTSVRSASSSSRSRRVGQLGPPTPCKAVRTFLIRKRHSLLSRCAHTTSACSPAKKWTLRAVQLKRDIAIENRRRKKLLLLSKMLDTHTFPYRRAKQQRRQEDIETVVKELLRSLRWRTSSRAALWNELHRTCESRLASSSRREMAEWSVFCARLLLQKRKQIQ